jgi:hypothetical protein
MKCKYKIILTIIVAIEMFAILYLFNFVNFSGRSTQFDIFPINKTFINQIEINSEFLKNLKIKYFFTFNPNTTQVVTEEYDNNFGHFNRTIIYSINSDGFRDREFSIEKPNNTFRIIAIGPSRVYGWGVEIEEDHVKVLEKLLNNNSLRKKYEVLNLGISGANLDYSMAMLVEKGLKYNPDLITVMIYSTSVGNNDYDRSLEINTSNEYRLEHPNASSSEIEDFANKAVENYENYALTQPEKQWQENVMPALEVLYNISISKKIPVVIYYHRFDPASPYSPYIPMLQDVSKKYSFYLFDMQKILMQYPYNYTHISPYDSHPSPFFHEIMAENLYRFLIENKLVS